MRAGPQARPVTLASMSVPASSLPAVPCSTAARERQDPVVGTAPPQHRYLLVEQDGGWSFAGFPALVIDEDIRTEVQRRAEAAGARVMLIRRPGRHASAVCLVRAWCVVDTRAPSGHRLTWGTWSYPADLLSAVEHLEQLSTTSTRPPGRSGPAPPTPTPPAEEPLVLVCTHGKKDPCCAVRGRPVAAALARRWPEQTWECSHTGGDRFAANLLLLPDGATYGGLDVDTALTTVEEHLAGRPGTAYLRGAGGWSRAVQAAIVAVHEQLGPLPWGQVLPEDTTPLEPDNGEVAATLVALSLDDGRQAQVEVREHVREAAQLTCRSGGAKVSQVPVAGTVLLVPPTEA